MPKKDSFGRREFLEKGGLALGAVAAMPALPPSLAGDGAAAAVPQRVLGRTGVKVSILAMGCGSRFLMYPADQASAVLEKVMASGINYLDTAVGYGEGESETRVGRVMATRRKDVFLATKVPTRARTRDAALKEVEGSLKRLQTDHLDLLHLHSLGDEADLAKIEAPDERNDLDCVQMAMNPARAARFEELALPAANRKNLGVILMKVTGQEKLMEDGGADTASLLRYAWSLPISTAVCGMPKLEHLEANVVTAKAYRTPLPPAEMERLRQQLAGRKFVLERFFAHHHDGGFPA
jgi:aryl-alcohol dehydrogenase-like predicted oxidoreductase